MKTQHKTAYTLIEFLVCLIIIALIIAAFAPIMTKKIQNRKVSILGVSPNSNIHDLFLPYDDIVKNKTGSNYECQEDDKDGVKTLKCKLKNINASKINVLLVGAGGGGAGSSTFGNASSVIEKRFTSTGTVDIVPHMADVKIHMIYSGSAGTDGIYYITTAPGKEYISSCPIGTTLVSDNNDKEKQYCITSYNLRPKDLLQIENYSAFGVVENSEGKAELTQDLPISFLAEDATALDITLNQESAAGIPKCRITPEEECERESTYPGCGRTVCNKIAAELFCENLDWGEKQCKDENGNFVSCRGRWELVTRSSAPNGCTNVSYYSGAKCYTIKRDGVCYCPALHWGYEGSKDQYHDSRCFCPNGELFESARCALLRQDSTKAYKLKSGDGGKSGSYSIINLDSVVSKCSNNEELGCQISMGSSGYRVSVGNAYYSCNGSSCTTSGGLSVSGRSIGPSRAGGKGVDLGTVKEFTPVFGGKGGEGYEYDGVVYGSGGDGGSVPAEDTKASPDSWYRPQEEVVEGKPGQGGIAVLKYILLYKGASGGGGGGGAYAMIKNIEITPDKEYEITIGGGGKGGLPNENGINGGDTIVNFDSKTYAARGGKGGKLGKSEDDESDERIGGLGGAGGVLEGIDVFNSIGGSKEGQAGTSGKIDGDYLATGGLGGRSGISMSVNIIYIACGGFYFDNNISCLNQDNPNGLGALYLNPMEKKPNHIYKENSLGSYGAGGGGGGWKYVEGDETKDGEVKAGVGGDGQGGYVYVWW